jgi:hypothetical protein
MTYEEMLPEDQATVRAGMRLIATLLTLINDLYDYDTNRGQWSPYSLNYEAEYLDRQARVNA